MAAPLINGTAYSWSQIDLRLFNTPVAGVTAISYEDTQEIEDNKGAGNRPVSRGYGSIECKGSITLEMAEVEALQAASSSGRLQDIPEFDIPISFLPLGGVIRQHTLHNCRFKANKRDMKQGDMNVLVELELMISHITWK
jgi:hypothetical protein